MIAALAGGSLPFILRTVMQPEKPEIEIGTVSFKNQMDEIIKNFVQCWPIYDLPLEEYTAEDEEEDRRKKEQQQQQQQHQAAASSTDARTREHRNSTPSATQSTTLLDMVGVERAVMHHVDVADSSARPPCDAAQSSSSAAAAAAVCQRVCFDVESKENVDDDAEVDVVIYLPRKHSDTWLDEWSDLDNDEVASSASKSLDNDVFQLTQLSQL